MGFLYPIVDAGDAINFGRNSAWYQTGDAEVEVVIRIEKTNAQGPIFSLSNPDTVSSGSENANCNIIFSLDLSLEQRPFYRHEYGSGTDWTSGSASAPRIPIGVWTRIKVTRIGTTITIFIDGQVVHTINYANAPYAGPSPAQSIWIGRVYTGFSQSYDFGRGFSIAYARYKGSSNNVLFTYGEDPGGAPGAVSPEMTATILDPFSHAVARPVQYQFGTINLDVFGGTFERKPQRGTGYILDMTGAGGGNTAPAEINPPRAYPLESTWKKANPTSFNN